MLTQSEKLNTLPRFNYVPSLDGIRGIAVLLVLSFHGSYGYFPGGWIGVDLFFVLSGYLITSLLQNEYLTSGRISLANFYIRRILRLFPPLVIFILLANVLWPFLHVTHDANRLISALASLFYFANLIPNDVLGPFMHLWSLSVEEHFYVFWPIITSAYLFKISFKNQLVVLASTIILLAIVRVSIYNSSLLADPLAVAYRFTLCRIDAILLGALFALVEQHKKIRVWGNKNYLMYIGLPICFFAIVEYVSLSNKYWYSGGFIITNTLCLLAVIFAVRNPTNLFLANKAFRWIGRRSYGIYVYHMPIFLAFEGLRTPHSLVNLALVTLFRVSATLIIAELSFRFIEQPILKYKSHYKNEPKTAINTVIFSD